jgi:hypothetical protein
MFTPTPTNRGTASWMRALSRLSFVLAALLLVALPAFAQSDNSQISGYVKDSAGAVVANAKVTVKNEATGIERTASANAEGYYVVTNVPPGIYTITAEASGFKRHEETGKKVDPGISATADIALQAGQVTETVTVTATATALQTETATVGKLVEGKQIEALQLNGRNPLFLALLKPGVGGGSLSGFSFSLTSGGFNINGSRVQENLITFDGAVGVRTRANGTSIGVADLDATQEVQILTTNYNAEYGRSSGGQIRIVTRSGGRDFHGSVYEYLRNSALNANSWARNRNANRTDCNQFPADLHCRPSPFRYNQFGYNLNGPVIIPGTDFNKDRNKLFWLWGQEWVRNRFDATLAIKVPTAKMRQGDFSELTVANNALRAGPFFLRDPQKTGACNAQDQTACFSDGGIINKIPANRLSPNGLALLRAMPEPNLATPNSSGQNFLAAAGAYQNQRKNTLSLDYYPTEKHQIRYRLQLLQYDDYEPFFGGTNRAPRIFDRPNQTTSVNWVWTVSPTWVSETLVAASRDQVFILVDTSSGLFGRSTASTTRMRLAAARKSRTRFRPSLMAPLSAGWTAGRTRRSPSGQSTRSATTGRTFAATTRSSSAGTSSAPGRTTSTRSTSPARRAARTTRTVVSSSATARRAAQASPSATWPSGGSTPTRKSASAPTRLTAITLTSGSRRIRGSRRRSCASNSACATRSISRTTVCGAMKSCSTRSTTTRPSPRPWIARRATS